MKCLLNKCEEIGTLFKMEMNEYCSKFKIQESAKDLMRRLMMYFKAPIVVASIAVTSKELFLVDADEIVFLSTGNK